MNIKVENLPDSIKQEILRHLEMDNFREAKRIRDRYQARQSDKKKQEEGDTDSSSSSSTGQDIPENENLASSEVIPSDDISDT